MSYKVLKAIDVELNTQSIRRAIRDLEYFQTELEEKCWELVQVLTIEGAEIAKMQVVSMDAFDTGELESSIQGMFFPEERCGFVIAEAPHAIYVEYGTGIVGQSFPHPEAEGNYEYDVNQHGAKGWVYKSDRDGKFHWTKGYVSRPFMYNTLRWLEEAAPDMASEILT